MSDRPISVGDLVVVVRPANFCMCNVGKVFVVQRIAPSPDGHLVCEGCGSVGKTTLDAQTPDGGWQGISQLKRIPPLTDLEGQRTEEVLRAPSKETA